MNVSDAAGLTFECIAGCGFCCTATPLVEVAEAPGMKLIFGPSKTAPTAENTRGTTVDHIGFEIKNLKEFLAKLEAKGIKLETAYREVPAIGLNISYLYDPAGTYIEMTEGYTGY